MNVILFIIGIILAFSTVVVLEKIFKQSGLYLWIAIASVLANIFVALDTLLEFIFTMPVRLAQP